MLVRKSSVYISRNDELSVLLQTLQTKGVEKNGPGYEIRFDALRNYSESQIDNFVADFGITNINSLSFKQQFLVCGGQQLARQLVNVSEGKVSMPKHFQNCKNMSFQETGKSVALLSFPGSGNSWVRQLIETTTGIYTGSYQDCDVSYVTLGMIGESVYTDNVIAVKTHFADECDSELSWLKTRDIIYIVRNPYDAILAEWKRLSAFYKKKNLEAHVSDIAKYGDKWNKAVLVWSKLWRQHIQKFLVPQESQILVVKYENLLTDLHRELKRMMEFLKFPYTEDDLKCTINSATESFHRKHKKVETDPYTPELRKFIKKQIGMANNVLRSYKVKY